MLQWLQSQQPGVVELDWQSSRSWTDWNVAFHRNLPRDVQEVLRGSVLFFALYVVSSNQPLICPAFVARCDIIEIVRAVFSHRNGSVGGYWRAWMTGFAPGAYYTHITSSRPSNINLWPYIVEYDSICVVGGVLLRITATTSAVGQGWLG